MMKIRPIIVRTVVVVLILLPAAAAPGHSQLKSAYAITEVQFPPEVRLGDEFEIVARARNLGVEAPYQNLQVGFPHKYDMLALVDTNCTVMRFYNKLGTQIRGGYDTVNVPLKYPLFEGAIMPSLPGDTIWMRIKVKPREAGIFRFETETGGSVGGAFPGSGHENQKGEYSLVHEVQVLP